MSDSANTGYRWTTVTPADRSGILYIVTVLGFMYTSIAFLTRVTIKWHLLGLEDGAMLVAQILNGVQFVLGLLSLSNGLARSYNSITTGQYSKMASTFSSGQIAIYLSLGFSKIATILLVRRLFIRDMKTAWSVCNMVICGMAIWTIASAIMVSAGCSAETISPETSSDLCAGIKTRYMIVVVTDGITDLVLATLPAYLCRHLQMKFLFKLQVLGIFALRLPLLALAGLFLKHWTSSLDEIDLGIARTTALIFQQTQLCVSLIAGTIPCLRSFIQSFDTGSGMKAGFGDYSSSGYGRHTNAQHRGIPSPDKTSYKMSLLERQHKGVATGQARGDGGVSIWVNEGTSSSRLCVDSEEQILEMERRSTQEFDRKSQLSTQDLVIRKEVRWEITRETT